jgi:beta-galactosidase GanA
MVAQTSEGIVGLRGISMALAAAVCALAAAPLHAELPRFESGALIVDGAPFLALGVQANNSSNYPEMLETMWPTMDRLGANTLLIPVAWEQVEPTEGQFDFAWVDALIQGARANGKRLVPLWYGAYKNTAASYAPAWVKADGARFPRMRRPDGTAHYALSPHGAETLRADARAFAALMTHLAEIDPENTVIMVQVENETGSYGLARDHAPAAAALFEERIPRELADALGIPRTKWSEAFGPRAEQFFMSWYMARYVEEVAAAGKAAKPLPMLVNAALGNAFTDEGGDVGPSGGPNWNALPIWRVAAPSIDAYGPDIYNRDPAAVAKFLERYSEGGAPLLVPEIGNAKEYARFAWPAFGSGAVLFAPFGIDGTGYSNYPLGAKDVNGDVIEAFAAPYRLLGPASSEWATIARDLPTWGTARGADGADQSATLGRWTITAQYGRWSFGEDDWTWIQRDEHPLKDQPVGGGLVAQLDADTFLVAGQHVKLRLALAAPEGGESAQLIEAQEGSFVNGEWVMKRRWNGDQIDYGFNFGAEPVWLRITMGSYK